MNFFDINPSFYVEREGEDKQIYTCMCQFPRLLGAKHFLQIYDDIYIYMYIFIFAHTKTCFIEMVLRNEMT